MTPPEPSQYFSEQPSGTEVRRTITARVWGRELPLITASGVFAADGLDRGTAVLLRASPIPEGSPRILDLGCGYGPIALAVAVHCPGALVDAVDVNERALACAATMRTRLVWRTGYVLCGRMRLIRSLATTRSGQTLQSESASRLCMNYCSPGCHAWHPVGLHVWLWARIWARTLCSDG